MGIIQNIKDKLTERRLRRLEGDINMLNNGKLKYDPNLNKIFEEYNSEREFSQRVAENFVWFAGKPRMLVQFYLQNPELMNNLNYFWRTATPTYRKVHCGIPNLICTKMPIIIFGSGYATKIDVYTKDAEGNLTDQIDKDASKKAIENLTALLSNDDLKIKQLLENQATNESRDGHTFAKISYDVNLSPYPIYEVSDIRNTEIEKERGITKAIIFKHYLESDKINRFLLKEIYTTDENDDAVIRYELYTISGGKEKRVDLSAHPFGKELQENNREYTVFKGVKGMLAFEKPNRLPNREFLDSPYGDSDYSGIISDFDGLDEIVSEMLAELRNNKTIRYVPKSMLQVIVKEDENGNQYESTEDLNNFVTNYQVINDVAREEEAKKIEYSLIPDKMESLMSKWRVLLNHACNGAGVSPLALGIVGLESVNSGADSQRERNKVTIETRSKKIELWTEYLKNVFVRILDFNKWMRDTLEGIKDRQKGIADVDVDWDSTDITITFPDYIVETDQELITTWGDAKLKGVASLETVVDNIHKDWDDKAKEEEVNRIKFEAGMSVDNPLNLQELTDLENEITNPQQEKPPEEPQEQQEPQQENQEQPEEQNQQ